MEKKKTNKKFIIILTVLVLVGGTYGISKYMHSLAHEETDDAQIEKKMNPIIPRVSGYISKVYVKDNDYVKKGDTLFTIDKRDYQLKIDEANAALLGAEGQYEAAKSLGMGYWKMNFLIILPQAIKTVIPGITNTFIALFKDTPLIILVGLLELLGMVNLAKSNSYWLGFAVEGYVFVGIIFWVFSYLLSRYTQSLEKKYSTEKH